MHQLFPPPDRTLIRCGSLEATVVERRVPGAPDFLRGLRALFVTDIHVLPRTTKDQLDAFAEKIDALSPDLLLLGGDYSDWAAETERLFRALKGIEPTLGCFGVIGNNDAEAWEGRLDDLRSLMAWAGCEMLCNGAVRVAWNGGTIHIAGVDEYRFGKPDFTGLLPASSDRDSYRILLSHYPVEPQIHPDLMLCGHTHGGQFNVLGLTPYAIGFERLRLPNVSAMAVSGFHDLGDMKLLVSKGVGASRIQLRVGVRPEMDLLVFE